MVEKVIAFKDIPAELRKVAEKDRKAAMRAVRRTLEVDAQRWIQWSIRGGNSSGNYRTPINTGAYANSWKHEMTSDGGIFYSTDGVKAAVIEDGRREAPIPIVPLVHWIRQKLGETDVKKATRIAFAISKTAAEKAREGLKVLDRAHPKIFDAYVKNIESELKKNE